jgi:hypothetical protein
MRYQHCIFSISNLRQHSVLQTLRSCELMGHPTPFERGELCSFHRNALLFLSTALQPREQDLSHYIKLWPTSKQREHPSARCLGNEYPSNDMGDGPVIDNATRSSKIQSSITRFFCSARPTPPPLSTTSWTILNSPHTIFPAGDTNLITHSSTCSITIDNATL